MLNKVKALLQQVSKEQHKAVYLNSLANKYLYTCVDNGNLIADHNLKINPANLTDKELEELYTELNKMLSKHDTAKLREDFGGTNNSSSNKVQPSNVF